MAGARKAIFDGSAIDAIFAATGGIPRRINRIGDLALLVGFADGKRSISARDIETVAAEFNVAPVAA
jgi:type II secretory pathway predicted ATPase ExeA